MTTRRGDDNGPPHQPEGSHQPVSGLPPEWGEVIIPDDATELDHEATKIRRELRRAAKGARWSVKSLFRAPVLIVVLAVLLALTSLLSILSPLDRSGQSAKFPPESPTALADITLVDEHNNTVRIGDHLPAAILLLDGCSCPELAATVAANAPAGVSVLLIGEQAPVESGPGIRLADPSGKVRANAGIGLAVPTEAAVLLINGQEDITRMLPGSNSIKDFHADLEALGR